MKIVTVEHRRLIFDAAYRSKKRTEVNRARNWRGRANGSRVTVIHEGDCCSLQPYDVTENIVWPKRATEEAT